MGPKITAAVRFLRGGGRVAIVTSPEQAAGTLGGTRIVLRHGNRTGEAA
jgi:carbamate kinase